MSVHTDRPDTPAPELICKTCARPLQYRKTVFGGTKPRERWDQYHCPRCRHDYEFRHRTRALRMVS